MGGGIQRGNQDENFLPKEAGTLSEKKRDNVEKIPKLGQTNFFTDFSTNFYQLFHQFLAVQNSSIGDLVPW